MGRIEEAIAKATRLRFQKGLEVATHGPRVTEKTPLRQDDFTSRIVESPFIITTNGKSRAISEEYKKLKSSIIKLTRGDQFRNVLMVTSALPGEGKSITSINLAITLSQEYDVSALLIDMDMRKPSISQYLNIRAEKGLSDCLIDGSDLSDAIVHTGIAKMSLLPAGRQVENPVELFSSHRMREIIEELRHRYPDRYVIIDSPPVLPIAETRILGHMVDGILLVVSEDLSSRKNIEETMTYLTGTHILGIVYNMATFLRANGSYPRYGQYYSQEPKQRKKES